MSAEQVSAARPGSYDLDPVVTDILDYVLAPEEITGDRALRTAHLVLLDSLGCALLALDEPDAVRTAEPLFASAVDHQPRIVATPWTADPVQAAFGTGTLIRWLDFNDTWLALEWGHPSDNLGAILPPADHLARRARAGGGRARAGGGRPAAGLDVLRAAVQAHEIQGVLALGTALNRHGLDHVAFIRVASAAVAARLLGGDRGQLAAAVTHAWADGGALRAYRHAGGVTARKSWAAGDAASRAVRLAYFALRGEEPCRTALSGPTWGFQDALLAGHRVDLPRRLGSYIMEHVLLKPRFPAEYHGQTAVEATLALRAEVADHTERIDRVEIKTHESAVRIIDKRGPLSGPADRDHCLQYMVAVALLYGDLTHRHYRDDVAADPRIDQLRNRIEVREDPDYSRAYLDPAERAVANAVRVHFDDGTATDWAEVRLPVGHPTRRDEAEPLVHRKLLDGLTRVHGAAQADEVAAQLADYDRVLDMPADDLVALATPGPPGRVGAT